jgi:hypothetical protein
VYKDLRYINAGTNEFYRWGRKAIEKARAFMTPNENGYYSIPTDGGKYWTFGTSEGKYGEFIKWKDTFFSVNKGGFAYAKAGTEKGDKFVEMIQALIQAMEDKCEEKFKKRMMMTKMNKI